MVTHESHSTNSLYAHFCGQNSLDWKMVKINDKLIHDSIFICAFLYVHYIAKSIGSPPFNEMFDYFSNFHENKS